MKAEKQQAAKCETPVQHQILHRNQRTVFTKADKTEVRPNYFLCGWVCFVLSCFPFSFVKLYTDKKLFSHSV